MTYIPEELRADWSGLYDAASQSFVVHQWRRISQSVFLDEFARDSGWHARAVRWNEEPHAGVTTATHGTASRVHHETYQKTAAAHYNDNNKQT